MNIVRGLVLLFVCAFIGYVKSLKYKNKTNFYTNFKDFNQKLKNEISFSQGSIIKLLEKYQTKSFFYNSISNYFENGKKELDANFLFEEDRALFFSYLDNVGYGDLNSQLKYLSGVGAEIEEKRLLAIENEKKYRTLYLKVGILVGLMLFVIAL